MTAPRFRGWLVAVAVGGCGPTSGSAEGEATGTGADPSSSSSSTTGPSSLGDGTTSASPETPCPSRRYPLLDDEACMAAAIGDVDGDGMDDLLVLPGPDTFLTTAMPRRLHTYRGGGPDLGEPELHCCIETDVPTALVMLDINGDGRGDPVYVAAHHELHGDVGSTPAGVDALVRGPAGGYLAEQRIVRGRELSSSRLTTGALLADQPAFVASDGGDELRMYAPQGLAWIPTSPDPSTMSSFVAALATLDLDGDGLDDVLAVLLDRVVALRSPGDGTLVPVEEFTPAVLGPAVHTGDLDATGSRDVVFAGTEGIAVGLVAAGTVEWRTQPEIVVDWASSLLDADGDGALDLLTATGGSLLAYRGAGDGTFLVPPVSLSVGVGEQARMIVSGDLDADGRADVAVCDELGVLVVPGTEP